MACLGAPLAALRSDPPSAQAGPRRAGAALPAIASGALAGNPRGIGSTTTTSTIFTPPDTTTLDDGRDVSDGGRFHGGFVAFGYDLYFFELAAPAVLVAVTSDGKDFCNADTTMRLSVGGTELAFDDESGPGQCSRIVFRVDAGQTYDLVVAGYMNQSAPDYYLDVQFVETECGNDVVELLEECDDGNAAGGDCCSPTCIRAADDTPCDNGLLCDGDDSCVAGSCTQHTLAPCPGADGDSACAESCSDTAAGCTFPDPESSACDDGSFCNGTDRCFAGSCSLHAGNPCRGGDGDANCRETCDEATDACNGFDPNGTDCDDTKFCNGFDNCSSGTCSLHTGNPCTGADGDANCSESCSESGEHCTAADPNGSPCTDGLFCTGADTCSGGACSVHAGSGCPGPDDDSNCAESCNEAALTCTAADSNGSPCNDGIFCNGPDSCLDGACSVHAGNPCPGADGDGNCAESCNETNDTCTAADPDGTFCGDSLFCNGSDTCSAGSCSVHTAPPCPGADGDGNCAESCNETTDTCTAADPNGSACTDGLFCNGSDTCSSGACTGHAGSPCPGADGDGNCAESCNETSDLCTASDPNGSACNDGVFCNGSDTCASGACSTHAGSPCAGPDGDGNCSESCNETSDNCTMADPNASACNDGVFCNGADTCSSGACSTHAGNPCPGVDGDGNCAESCNESNDSCTTSDPNGSTCSDGLFCNGSDTCSSGVCSTHAGSPCPGVDGDGNCAESCDETLDTCAASDPNGSACNDGVFCNGADTCASGACSTHAGSPCPGADGDGNCAESCNEGSDSCTASDPNGSACSDALFCNGADTCAGGACSQHAGDPCPGLDGDGNCSESCNETTDACTAADANGSACNDGLFCNGADTCASGACSTHAGNPCSGADGDGNCSESCNESGDACTAADPNGSACTDGLFCNGADTCAAGACSTHAGNPCSGADGDGNCAESCNETGDACTAADPNGSACTDGLFCNGADTCAAGACSTHAGNPCPGADGDGSCTESCNETGDVCTAADPNGSACNDGLFCNGADTCASGECATHAGNPCPGADGDGNCSETCDETSDSCGGADANGSACNDGVFCNGADTCTAGACSTHAGNPCPGADGDGNCAETCSETVDTCSGADPNGSPCDNGLACDGSDTCLAGGCTQHTGNPCPGADGDGDCAESCSDFTATCTGADPNGSSCDDGVFCNGADRCANGSCNVHLGNPCPGADGDGNCAESCNEAAGTCDAVDPDGLACGDGIFCNGGDSCASGSCSVHAGDPCDGPDGDFDCSEVCNEAADACSGSDPNGAACNDGLFCNGSDTCSGGTCSAHAGSPCQGADGDGNCAESCSETGDNCTAADPNGSACGDGLFCNGTDSCSAGACSQHAGSPCPGADGDGNCAESCNEPGDACDAPDANQAACDDGLFCNGADACVAGGCTHHAGDACPGADGDGNCAESCSEAADACNAPDSDGSVCNDGLFCDGADTCAGGACSEHAGNPCPGADGDGNCAESCDEAADACSAADPSGSACIDGVFCNGADTCAAGACSGHAGSPCSGADGDADCSETCNEESDACDAVDPDSSPCDDGNACTTTDTCEGQGDCEGGPPVDCDDDDPCTNDACSGADPLCTHDHIAGCPPPTTTTLEPPAECGDANGDGNLTASDALLVLRSAVGGNFCDAVRCLCDVNSTGTLTAGDALLVLRRAVNAPAVLVCDC